jgi:hypothetical protein
MAAPMLVVLLVIALTVWARARGLSLPVIPLFLSVAALAAGLFVLSYVPAPLAGYFAARSWVATPCTILSNAVESSTNSRGRVFTRLALRYAYEVSGRRLEGTRYEFGTDLFSGGDKADEIAASLPPGTQTTCYVDPRQPDRAVVRREFSTDLLSMGLPGLAFAGLGTGILLSTVRDLRARMQESGS